MQTGTNTLIRISHAGIFIMSLSLKVGQGHRHVTTMYIEHFLRINFLLDFIFNSYLNVSQEHSK